MPLKITGLILMILSLVSAAIGVRLWPGYASWGVISVIAYPSMLFLGAVSMLRGARIKASN